MSILIKNGYVVLESGIEKSDIFIEGARIAKIGLDLSDSADTIIDATDKTVIPGLIDMHCHLREPGYEYKEDIFSGTRAALQGGFTAVCCMPNTSPVIDTESIVKYVVSKASEVDNAKVYPIGAITKGQLGKELSEMGKMKKAGIVAVSDDGRPVVDGNVMRLALEYASTHNLLVISHCEDLSIAADGVVNEGLNSTIAGLKGISRVSEETMVAREVLLAESLNARVHIAHISTRNSVEIIRNAKKRGVQVTAETCPHYFAATDDEILNYNTNAKINPPLRTQDDVDAIIGGIKDGTIDAIATDHAPHHADEKNKEFNYAPNGTVGLETAFALGITYLVMPDHIDLAKLVELMSYNPAKILNVPGGKLAEGERADITIVDTREQYTVDTSKFVSKGKNSLFSGWSLYGIIKNVIVDGIEKQIKAF